MRADPCEPSASRAFDTPSVDMLTYAASSTSPRARRSDRARCFAALVVLALGAAGCHEVSAPRAVTEPRITLARPDASAALDEVVVEGVAEAPGGIEAVYAYLIPEDAGQVQHFRQPFDGPPSTRVPFQVSFRDLPPGRYTALVEAYYRRAASDSVRTKVEVRRTINVLRRGRLTIVSGLADTLYQRTLHVEATTQAGSRQTIFELVTDPGTPAERRDADTLSHEGSAPTAALRARLMLPDTLAEGSHRVVVRLFDDAGLADSAVRTVVVRVPEVRYTLAVLPGLGGSDAMPLRVSDAGVVAGWALDAQGRERPVVWRNGIAEALSLPAGYDRGAALALSDDGRVAVGRAVATGTADVFSVPVVWRDGTPQVIDTVTLRQAVDVNAAGVVLVEDRTAVRESYLWADGQRTALPGGCAMALNDRGQVVGTTRTSTGSTLACTVGLTVELPTIPTPPRPRLVLFDVNNAQQVVGALNGVPFLAAPGAAAVDLRPFVGDVGFEPRVLLNDRGLAAVLDPRTAAVYLYREGRTSRVRVTTPGWRLDAITSINDAGVITAHAIDAATGARVAMLLSPAE